MKKSKIFIKSRPNVKKNKFFTRLSNSQKVMETLIGIVYGTGNDKIDVSRKDEGRFIVYPAPGFEEIMTHTATMVPMPLMFAYLPRVYFSIFSRLIIATMDPVTMVSARPVAVKATDLYKTLPFSDKKRFPEVIKFFIKYKLLDARMTEKNGKTELVINLADPYRNFYCATNVAAMTIVAKTHMVNNASDHLSDGGRWKWREYEKVKPIIVNYDDLRG